MRRFRIQQRKRQTWLDLPASGIEEVGHGQEQRTITEGQANKGEGATRSDRRREALDDALLILGERHGFEEWQETVSTFIINIAAAPAAESERFISMSRPELVIKEKWSQKLEEFAATGVEA